MPLANLGGVTGALLSLVSNGIRELPEWTSPAAPDVTALPPDLVTGTDTLSLYLFHVEEDSHFKNQPPPGRDRVPVRFTPMGLRLYYQLSTHASGDTSDEIRQAQRRFGLAIKILHDHPKVDENTQVSGIRVLQDGGIDGAGNSLTLDLQPVKWEDAAGYWTAGSNPLRLAAYYKASVVFLEPETPRRVAGRVFEMGIHSFVRGAPRLAYSESDIVVRPPGSPDPLRLRASPAQVVPAMPLVLVGGELGGDDVRVEVRRAGEPWRLLGTGSFQQRGDRETLSVIVPQDLGGEPLVPAIYGARAVRSEVRALADAGSRQFTHASNEVPLVVMPRVVDPIAGPDAAGRFTIAGGPFGPASAVESDSIEVFVAGDRLALATGAPAAGQFQIVDAATLRFQPPATSSVGVDLAVGVRVNGVDSPPRWVHKP